MVLLAVSPSQHVGGEDISIRYLRNQMMPDVNANVVYRGSGTGGSRYQTDISAALEGRPPSPAAGFRARLRHRDRRRFGAAFPTWTVGVRGRLSNGRSQQEASLARSRLQYGQAETQLRNLELQVATQVRERGGRYRRIRSASKPQCGGELAERRLEAAKRSSRPASKPASLFPGPARPLAGPNLRGARHLGLQQVAGRFRGRPGGAPRRRRRRHRRCRRRRQCCSRRVPMKTKRGWGSERT